MIQETVPSWLHSLLTSFGVGVGLFTLAFFDSSVLTFPVLNDLLLINFSIQRPERMPYYVVMSTLGSLAGCFWLYYLAKKGGEAMYRKRTGQRAERVRAWVLRNKFLSVAVPAILPPPAPFKAFVLAAGVFQVPIRTFTLALLAGRGLRYSLEGFLAIRYGTRAARFFVENKLEVTVLVIGTIVLTYAATRWVFGGAAKRS